MRLIIGGRQAGKTTQLIQMSAENGYYIVVPTQRDAAWVAEQARQMELDIPFPLTFDEFVQHRYYGKGIKGFLIDNADLLWQYIAGYVKVVAAAINAVEAG